MWLKVRKRSALACMSLRFASLLSNILPPQRHFASKRTPSQQQWLRRQETDIWAIKAQQEGLRSRAAYKLMHLDDRYRFFRRGQVVVDLGAAPGGWSLIAAQRVAAPQSGRIVSIDLLPVAPSPLFKSIIGDFTDAATCMQLIDSCGGGCDVVLCDAAPNSSGQQWADHLRSVELCASALEVACRLLSFGNGSSAATGSGRKVATAGTFVTKLWSGGEQQQLIADMRSRFMTVNSCKPPASRPESVEMFFVCQGFKRASTA